VVRDDVNRTSPTGLEASLVVAISTVMPYSPRQGLCRLHKSLRLLIRCPWWIFPPVIRLVASLRFDGRGQAGVISDHARHHALSGERSACPSAGTTTDCPGRPTSTVFTGPRQPDSRPA